MLRCWFFNGKDIKIVLYIGDFYVKTYSVLAIFMGADGGKVSFPPFVLLERCLRQGVGPGALGRGKISVLTRVNFRRYGNEIP